MILCILIRTVTSCPSSVPTSAGITTEQASFTGSSNILIRGVAAGKVSNSLYYLYDLSSTSNVVVRKEDTSGSQLWMASFAFRPVIKSLSIDAQEQIVYFAQRIVPVVVMRLSSSTGAVVSQES